MHLSARATPHAGPSDPRHSASSRDSVHSETVANCHAHWVAGARAEVVHACLRVGVGSSFSSFVSAGRLWMCVSCQADRAPYNVNVTTCAHESRHKSPSKSRDDPLQQLDLETQSRTHTVPTSIFFLFVASALGLFVLLLRTTWRMAARPRRPVGSWVERGRQRVVSRCVEQQAQR